MVPGKQAASGRKDQEPDRRRADIWCEKRRTDWGEETRLQNPRDQLETI